MVDRRRSALFLIVYVLIPLLIGALLYYLFFPDVRFVRFIDSQIGLNVHPVQAVFFKGFVGILFRNYFFDYLWAFAFANSVFWLLQTHKNATFLGILIPFIMGIGYEIAQICEFTIGTPDLLDIFAEALGVFAAYFFMRKYRRIQK